jgi:hypothetical protein
LTDGIASDLFYLNLSKRLTARFAKQAQGTKLCDIYKSYCPLWLKIMIATIENIKVDLSKPIDISIPITNTMPTQLLGIENR